MVTFGALDASKIESFFERVFGRLLSSSGSRFGGPKGAQRGPKGAQGRAQRRRKLVGKIDLYGDGFWKRLGSDFGTILEPFWSPNGAQKSSKASKQCKNALNERSERAQRASGAIYFKGIHMSLGTR